MRRIHVLSVICAVTVCCSAAARAAENRPFTLSEVNNVMNLADAELVTLHVPTFADARGGFALEIPVGDDSLRVEMLPHSIRSENYVLRVQLADGTYADVQPGPITTFRGFVTNSPGTKVYGSLTDNDGLTAQIVFANGQTRWIEPLRERITAATPLDYVTYRGDDVLPSEFVCGTDDEALLAEQFGDPAEEGTPELGFGDCGGLCVADLACDADVEYYVSRGSSIPNVESRINQIVNLMNVQYENQCGIRHVISGILVRTAEPDPYSSTNSSGLLAQFRNQWLLNHQNITHDVANLFTGKNIDGSTIGQASTIGGICTTQRYCYTQAECCGSTQCAKDLLAHELGHLWNGLHCQCLGIGTCFNTMNSGLQCANTFRPENVTRIVSHRNTRNCLDPFDPGPAPGPFNLLIPMDNQDAVPVNISFDWADSAAAETYSFELDDDPTFATPHAEAEGLLTSDFTPSLPLIQGKTYFWRVTAFNQVGEQESNPQLGSFTTIFDCDGNGLDDAAEISLDPELDCNNNDVLDACDISGATRIASSDVGPIISGSNQTIAFTDVPNAVGDVTIRVRSLGDLNFSTEFYDVEVNGVPVGAVFDSGLSDCTLLEELQIVPAADWNTALGGGDVANIEFIPSPGVAELAACPDSFVFAEISYLGTPTSLDVDMNNQPDECGAGFSLGDMNCDGVISVGDIGGFVLALTDPAGYDLQFPDCDIDLADVNMDGMVSVGDIGPFVALLTQ